jgi:hypothetical protein
MKPAPIETFLRCFLRLEGTISLLALFAVVMPYSSMDATHQWLGLGRLPDQPIVGYLARSLSAFYALFGAFMWYLSFDLHRHRPTLCFLGVTTVVFGLILLGIDWFEGLPLFWRLWEGPMVCLIGAGIAWPAFRLRPREGQTVSTSGERLSPERLRGRG